MVSSLFFTVVSLATLTWGYPLSPLFHNCGLGSGEEICQDRKLCTPLVVRPLDLPKPVLPTPKVVCAPVGGVPPLVPIGDPCSCHTALVKPAVVPKPCCKACVGKIDVCHDQQLTLSQKQQILFGGGYSNDVLLSSAAARPVVVDEIVKKNTNPADYVPADPVSLSLAYKLAQESCHQSEDKLAFGFRRLPKDIPLYTKKRNNNIPEENLFQLNGQIVELKKVKCDNAKSVDEEAAEQLMDLLTEEEEEGAAGRIDSDKFRRISLGEIGYRPADIKAAAFISVPASGGSDVLDDAVAENLKDCNDGFQPGNVVITQVPKGNAVELPPELPEPCFDDGESLIPPPPALPNVYSGPYTYLSSSSSCASSAANKCSQSVFLQKIGCN